MERADGTVEKELRYDLKGNLTEETNALGEKTLYTYDTAGRRTGMWEQAGEDSYRVTVYLYDGADNVTEERRGKDAVRALERPVHFLSIRKEYDRENRLVRVEDGTGARVCYTYDLMNNCTGEESLEDDRTGRKVLYTYDRAGRLVRKEAQLVKLDGGAATVQGSSITSYAYDRDNCLISVKLPEGGTVRYVYDGADRPVCWKRTGSTGSAAAGYTGMRIPVPSHGKSSARGEDRIKTQNAFLMHCEGLDGYISEEAGTLICREKPQQVLYYHGKKAGSIYSRLEEVYHDLSIPPGEKMPDYGEEGRDYLPAEYHYDFRGSLACKQRGIPGRDQ